MLAARPSISSGTRRCIRVPQMTLAACMVPPTMIMARAIIQTRPVNPMSSRGKDPAPHIRIITVRYRRARGSDDTMKDPAAPARPNNASTVACVPGSPPWSRMTNGSRISMGPTTTST
ncbi:Uncharacterised protein [Mycobacteroides abscessus subsp. massiliense]|nr:Uncharacterised protein [Mycobacteroides abscessus subsp. massiliense]